MRSGDDQLMHRAARDTGLRAAALVAVAMLLLIGLVTFVVVRGQSTAADDLLRSTVANADDVRDPPPGAWLVMTRAGRVTSSPGLPVSAAVALTTLRADATTTTRLTDLSPTLRAATVRQRDLVVQMVLDLRDQHEQRNRLIKAMAAAGALALLFAAGLGVLLGRRAVRPLAEALALQRSFIADASHELRTPLTLLSTRAQLLADELHHAAPQLQEDSAGVVNDVQRLGEVLEDLLLLADPQGQQPREQIDLAALVEAALTSARPHAEQRGVLLVAPAAGPELPVLGWAPALRRAVLSLVDNAIDHTPDGGTVTVSAFAQGQQVIVEIADTGPGIDPAAARDVLRRFHSGGQRSGRAHYGLGLALTNDVANQHGGYLQVLQRPVGAAFRLSLPALSRHSASSKTRLRKRGEAEAH